MADSPSNQTVAEWLPGSPSSAIAIDAIHDGACLQLPSPIAARSDVRQEFQRLRATGTHDFAHRLHSMIPNSGILIVALARVTLDLDLPPGVDTAGRHRAIGTPVAPRLSVELRRKLIQTYRSLLITMAEARQGIRLWVSIRNREDDDPRIRIRWSVKPPPHSVADPLIPREVLASLCKPTIAEAIASELGADGEPISEHSAVPANSLASRAAAFHWLKYLQDELEQYGPARNEIWDSASRELWAALLDTSGLSSETYAIRSYLYHQLDAPTMYRERYQSMAARYARAQQWLDSHLEEMIAGYKNRPKKQEEIVIELPRHRSQIQERNWSDRLASGIQAALKL